MSFVAKGTRRLPVSPEVAFDRLADLGWDPLESTCRHASLSIL